MSTWNAAGGTPTYWWTAAVAEPVLNSTSSSCSAGE
jgi:hypothetical protein